MIDYAATSPPSAARPRTPRRIGLFVLLLLLCLVAAGVAVALMYRAAFEHHRTHLRDVARSQAALVRIAAAGTESPDELARRLAAAAPALPAPADSGDVMLAWRTGAGFAAVSLVPAAMAPVPVDTAMAESVRLALAGAEGSRVETGADGEPTLVAYRPAGTGLAIAVRQPFAHLRAPLYRATAITAGGTLLLVAVVMVLLEHATRPVVRRLVTDLSAGREAERAALEAKQELEREVARRTAELAARNRLYAVLSHAGRATAQLHDKETFYRELCRIIVEEGGFRMAWIGETEGYRVRPVTAAGVEEGYLDLLDRIPLDDTPRGQGPVASAVKEDRTMVINDITGDARMAPWREEALARGYRSVASLPFHFRDRPAGTLNVYAGECGYFNDANVDLLSDLAGDISHALTVFAKERQRSEAIERLRELSGKLYLHIEKTPLGVVEFDPRFRIVDWNPAAEQLFGYPLSEVIGRRAEFLLWPEDVTRVEDTFARLIEGEGIPRITTDNRTRSGERIACHWYTTVIRDDDGTLLGVMSLVQDITEVVRHEQAILALNASLEERVRERTAELERVNRELEAFSYSVSHDLRAPLRAIDGFSRLLQERYDTVLDGEGRDFLVRVRKAVGRMAGLIEDLLRLSRAGRQELRREPVDLSRLAAEVVTELRHGQPERRVEVDIVPGLLAEGDPRLLRVLLDNLLGNAWKFTARRDPARIRIDAERHGDDTVFRIHDNGAGFDMAHARQLFAAFQRLHPAAEFEGSGIGLATAQRIVHRHGGRIWAEAAPDQGATFHFTLGAE